MTEHVGAPLRARRGTHRAAQRPQAFSKIKKSLCKVAARSKEALVEALGAALSAVSSEEARGYFEHAGYRPVGQLP